MVKKRAQNINVRSPWKWSRPSKCYKLHIIDSYMSVHALVTTDKLHLDPTSERQLQYIHYRNNFIEARNAFWLLYHACIYTVSTCSLLCLFSYNFIADQQTIVMRNIIWKYFFLSFTNTIWLMKTEIGKLANAFLQS